MARGYQVNGVAIFHIGINMLILIVRIWGFGEHWESL